MTKYFWHVKIKNLASCISLAYLPALSPSLVFVCRDWSFHLAEIPVSLAHLEYSLVSSIEIDARPVLLDLLLQLNAN